ncbi:hypothetical protein BFW01_g1578 [Lasiodiplodia theobromae]|uniref:Uncharacterized protein n=1 Tax=Lasiodiplodia theobromae TaxID=45133 RepID=A0A5N5CVT5_9PEZI|nr:Lipid phosphate phosphatase 2 [Lasiodiplodia theobromae]KAB2569456.1 hypothetical protein DBV05_g11860 [Lasiodiplodia theobromae]KAF4534940.1 Lipid phosphate phosphatase 2 [Lasiodiplodia theobromae]KAF9641595.1 hypothetical protein BFW01_g1578 [Lasiodiplodia theobromae]
MPPSHARTALSASIRCNACVNASVARRTFASSPASLQIPPESPRYIEVPKAPQQTAPYTPVVKGSLPVPRNIFVTRSKEAKESAKFLLNATREPSDAAPPSGPHADRLAWEQRLAALRRKNLREGVAALHKRKKQSDEYLAQRGARRQNEQVRLIKQPPRDDEVFTSPSTPLAVRNFLKGMYYVPSKVNPKWKRKRVERIEAAKSDERKDMLHTLYVHARDYIVTEDQLSKVIEDTFGTQDNLPGFAASSNQQGRSIWARGELLNMEQMLQNNQGLGNRALEKMSIPELVTQERIHRIAEELTGGKIARADEGLRS